MGNTEGGRAGRAVTFHFTTSRIIVLITVQGSPKELALAKAASKLALAAIDRGQT